MSSRTAKATQRNPVSKKPKTKKKKKKKERKRKLRVESDKGYIERVLGWRQEGRQPEGLPEEGSKKAADI